MCVSLMEILFRKIVTHVIIDVQGLKSETSLMTFTSSLFFN